MNMECASKCILFEKVYKTPYETRQGLCVLASVRGDFWIRIHPRPEGTREGSAESFHPPAPPQVWFVDGYYPP